MATSSEAAPLQVGTGQGNDEARRTAEQRQRQRQALELQRENILSQKTSNAGRRAALEAALAQVEAELAKLG